VHVPPLIAHRLSRAYGPDSSATALAGALARPLDGVETDVCLSGDGELALLHDPLLPLCTTLDGWAHRRSAADIRGSRLLDSHGEPSGERPLFLDELLDAVPPEITVQLDVKAHADPDLARRTAEAICDRYRGTPERRRIEVISFHSAACAAAAARGFRSRLVIYADYAPEALAAWHRVGGVSVEHFLLSQPVLSVLRFARLSVNAGTVNDVALLERVVALGVDAVCTDRPHELRAEAIERLGATRGDAQRATASGSPARAA
jgi:glycerophosphoryl diester phosphodiesterase